MIRGNVRRIRAGRAWSTVGRLGLAVLLLGLTRAAAAQETPRPGGELVFVVPAEPPSFDAHREESFALIHPAAPHYSTLLRVDPDDPSATKIIGDLAESWTSAHNGRTWTFKIRRGVKFHDGSDLTAGDIKASYDKIIFPPAGVASNRKGEYVAVEAVEAPDASTVVFRLKWPAASFLASLASPFNWIYKAEILTRDIRWYEKNVMGTGPFVFGEYVKGSHWTGRKNPAYWDRGKPYLDGYRALFVREASAQVAAIRGLRAMIQFRGFSPPDRDSLVHALGSRIRVQESPWECGNPLAVNHERKPFDDRRVRRALTLALDRYQGAAALSKISIFKEVVGVQGVGTPFATPPAELEKLAGYGRDIAAARAEARRLLKEAGVSDGFSFTFRNRAIRDPYEPLAVWLVDQWRQIGLTVRVETLELATLYNEIRGGNFDVAADFHCGYIVEPDLALFKFQSSDVSHVNYSRYTDRTLDELYQRQSRAADREERRRAIREFEKRLLDDEVHYIFTFQWHRVVPHNARLRGWMITPSHFLNNQLDTVWLAPE